MTPGPLSVGLRFRSERFDYRSDLPPAYNAGNRFYGRDVAEFLAGRLSAEGWVAQALDEDWGWLVQGPQDAARRFEVAVYNLAEHGEGGRPGIGEWGLWLRAYERRKVLGFLPGSREVAVPERLRRAVEQAIVAAGAEPLPWSEGPG